MQGTLVGSNASADLGIISAAAGLRCDVEGWHMHGALEAPSIFTEVCKPPYLAPVKAPCRKPIFAGPEAQRCVDVVPSLEAQQLM